MSAFFKNTLAVEGIDEPRNRPTIAWALLIAILAMAIRVLFWCYTGRVWEDTLITVLHSENCAQGLGLTHHPSEPRVHGFTSPLSVLVPLAADVVHVGWGIPFIKLASIFCGALSVFCVMAISIHPRVRLATPLAVMAMGFVALEHHHVFFGMSGMETQMVTLVLLMSIYYIIADRPVHLGLSLGLCMLARPDFGLWTIIVGLYLLCRRPKRLLTVVPAAFCVYGPWIIFTTLYYGSPIPNTLLAKMLGYSQWWKDPNLTWIDAKRTFIDNLVYHVFAQTGPTHLGHAFQKGTFFWDKRVISNAVTLLAGVGAVAAFVKKRWELVPPAVFVLTYAVYYDLFVPVLFPWYFPPLTAATVVLCAFGLDAATSWIRFPLVRTPALGFVAALYLGFIVSILPTTFRAEKAIQETVENGVRKRIGLYLNAMMTPEQTLGCEPLGYVGYYSRRTVYDFPGMGSKKVTDFLRSHPDQRNMNGVFKHFRPDYLLLRPWEYDMIRKAPDGNWIDQDYELERAFEVAKDAPQWLQDDYAAHFMLLRKKL
jgi:hypothetical protein